jgi:hypothetical protein
MSKYENLILIIIIFPILFCIFLKLCCNVTCCCELNCDCIECCKVKIIPIQVNEILDNNEELKDSINL